MKTLTAFFAAALGAGALLAQTVDQNKFKPLHDAGKAFEKGVDDPSASVEEVRDLRLKLDREAAVSTGAAATAEEKRVVEIYSAAARGYEEARGRFDRDKSRAKFFADLHRIQADLKEADELYSGTAKLAPPPPPRAAPPAVLSEPIAAPAPPPPAPVIPPAPPVKTPTPPAPVVPPVPPVVVPPPPAPVAPPAPPAAVPPPPAPVIPPASPVVVPLPPAPVAPPLAVEPVPAAIAPPPVMEKTAPAPAPPPAPLPAAPVAEPAPPRADIALNGFRKAANRVKIDKDPSAVSGCSRVMEFTVADSGSGVYEIAGHNFYYGNTQELIRLKTAEAGGDRFVVKAKSKTEISGEAYRCGK